jgi:Flp pilus assembly protein TadD
LLLLRYGEILLKLQKYSEAEKIFQRVLDLEYPHPDTYNGLAAVYFYQNQFAKAESILNQAVKLNIANGETYYNLAEFYFNKGDSDKAMNFYDRSIRLGFLPAFFRKARLLEVKGETQPAFDLLQKAEKMAPRDAQVNAQRGMIYIRHRQFQEAIQEFETAMQKNPEEKGLLYNIGFCYYRLEDKEKARKYLKEFLKLGSAIPKEQREGAQQMLNN